MSAQLNDFVESHPSGWNHDEWLALLADLGQGGTDVSNRTLWDLDNASVEELARVPGMNRALAEKVLMSQRTPNGHS
jgi:hypothetical protein